ncbi:DUF3099 domain-containing protein [Citricoccus sp. SGAir0253]|uniref:DUF3099 domain-containing protein n=1 Tax=Citricoccus sp. SGAir0253 TaxID=2567881 RepID=UPI0010CD2943|nr:DUF3099 domain-containing protein [Citricoccus sp. SGAir0253]QCU78097.1 DUF3099 domain-containing protein [Citricoccus sp. SGAir0253]
MSIRPAETGRHPGRPRRDHADEVYRITSAPAPGHEDRDARFVRYAWQMGIRTACFVAAFFTHGWLQIVFFILAIVLPYLAVVLANNGAVSNGEVLDAVQPADRPEAPVRLALEGTPETVVGTTVDDGAPALPGGAGAGPDGARDDRDDRAA